MVGWHHRFNEHELGQIPGNGERQGGLVCCGPWDLEESDTNWRLNNIVTEGDVNKTLDAHLPIYTGKEASCSEQRNAGVFFW